MISDSEAEAFQTALRALFGQVVGSWTALVAASASNHRLKSGTMKFDIMQRKIVTFLSCTFRFEDRMTFRSYFKQSLYLAFTSSIRISISLNGSSNVASGRWIGDWRQSWRRYIRRSGSGNVNDANDAIGGREHTSLHVDRFAGVGTLVDRSEIFNSRFFII